MQTRLRQKPVVGGVHGGVHAARQGAEFVYVCVCVSLACVPAYMFAGVLCAHAFFASVLCVPLIDTT